MEYQDIENDKLKKAKKRVEELKGFYIHLTIYIIINSFIMVNILVRALDDGDTFWQFGTFFTPFFWGIGLAFHAAKVFNFNPILGKNWEERQIQKYIDKDKRDAEKYK
ncbi:2TM domain-containing protein [uncultured Muriicola sp.]|uniref:2TM domain-containing protein n=1 Tax=uncultured Muriicola sp. TaxID=1583102 RepID=UPI00262CB236|nr:2TM domain-containing protein [uncultured Muriicola sp.]